MDFWKGKNKCYSVGCCLKIESSFSILRLAGTPTAAYAVAGVPAAIFSKNELLV